MRCYGTSMSALPLLAQSGWRRIPVSCSAYRCACLCPAYSECQDAMQQGCVIKSVIPSRCSELLAFRYFGIGIGFNEIWSAVGREAKVDTRISIEPQCSVYRSEERRVGKRSR